MSNYDYDEICLDRDQRRNIINDILRWKLELEMDNNDFSGEQFDEYKHELETTSATELCEWWMGNVGEWVASRQDCVPPVTIDFETYIDYQLGLVIDGRLDDLDYGYLVQYP